MIWQDNVTPAKMTWQDAIDYCDALNFAGSTEWRLPTIDELVYITDKSKTDPTINPVFINTVSDFYWSATPIAWVTSGAWYIYFGDGDLSFNDKSDSNFVRCVRGAVAQAATFTRDDATEIVTDTQNHLQWQDEPYTQAEIDAVGSQLEERKALYWESAIAYCENLTFGGKDDWRLPNYNELNYIVDRTKFDYALSDVFVNAASDYYWSATTVASYTGYAWDVYFDGGDDLWDGKSSSGYVRCVR